MKRANPDPIATEVEWNPALAQAESLRTYTYHHSPPLQGPVILGVDEAGRGPVLGPMVYGVAYCQQDWLSELATVGFQDSKVLSPDYRSRMLRKMVTTELSGQIGWAVTSMSALDISKDMLRSDAPINLNEQAHHTTMDLIQKVCDSGVQVAEAYIDTVGPPESYAMKLRKRFPQIKFVVAKKADSLYPIVSCASICAKVTRDQLVELQLSDCGSGYPSDPRTVKWLSENIDAVFGWGALVRYSWSTAKELLEKRGVRVDWPEDQKPKWNFGDRSNQEMPTLDWYATPGTIL